MSDYLAAMMIAIGTVGSGKKKWQKTAIFFVFCFLFHGTYLKARDFECMVLVLL